MADPIIPQHIVEPLYRAKNARDKTGNGIGLSIVKKIADIHDATLEIVSELNIGTTVTVIFPIIGPLFRKRE